MENVTLDNYQFYVDFGELISKVSGFILIFTNAQTNVAIKSFLITKADLQPILQKLLEKNLHYSVAINVHLL